MSAKYYVCFFENAKDRRLAGMILQWHPDHAYSVRGCDTFADAMDCYLKESAFFEKHGWTIA